MDERPRAVPGGRALPSSTPSALLAVPSTEIPSSPLPIAPGLGRADDLVLTALVRKLQAGDARAFDTLYQLTREDVARTLRQLVGPRADLEDLLQETFLRLHKAAHTFRGDAQFRTFLYRVCSNVALTHLRWWRRRREELTAEPPERVSTRTPEGEVEALQAARLVERALQQLTVKKRLVFVYHELCGMGPEEIATIVGTSPNTVRSRLHHARLEFADAMKVLLMPKRGAADGA